MAKRLGPHERYFDPNEWRKDTMGMTIASRGCWADTLVWFEHMQVASFSYGLDRWALVWRATPQQARQALEDFATCPSCRVTYRDAEGENNGQITVTLTDVARAYERREKDRGRQQRFREKGGGDPKTWTAIRVRILKLDNHMCAYCGNPADTVDHVIPSRRGGPTTDDNLVACCRKCNLKKRDRPLAHTGMTWHRRPARVLGDNDEITPDPGSKGVSSSPPNNPPIIIPERDPEKTRKSEKTPKKKQKPLELPEWLDPKLWEDFRAFREHKDRKRLSVQAEKVNLTKLTELRKDGNDPKAVIEQTIGSNWAGFYPVKRQDEAGGDGKNWTGR